LVIIILTHGNSIEIHGIAPVINYDKKTGKEKKILV
jgi:hypothetical protein